MASAETGVLRQGGKRIDLAWDIPDFFFRVENNTFHSTYSPQFSFLGCKWQLQLPHRFLAEGMRIHVWMREPSDDACKTVCFTCGVAKPGETIRTHTFSKTDSALMTDLQGLYLTSLKSRRTELVPSDTLTVTCSMQEIGTLSQTSRLHDGRPPADVGPTASSEFSGLEKLSSRLGELFASRKKCDVILKVKDQEFEAHKFLLMAQSPVFAAMFEHDTVEAQTGIVTVPDCDPDSFGDFLRYLYTGKFQLVTPGNAHHLYVTADKYDVPELKSFCVAYMARNLTPENVSDVISLADQYEEVELMASAQNFFNRNLSSILATPEWMTLMRTNCQLANRLFQEMAKVQRFDRE